MTFKTVSFETFGERFGFTRNSLRMGNDKNEKLRFTSHRGTEMRK